MVQVSYPGVYLSELPFSAKSIEGVSTSTDQFADEGKQAPSWTDANSHDPGMSLLELFAWPEVEAVYRDLWDAAERTGLVGGLSIGPADDGDGLNVSPGLATGPDGRPLRAELVAARPGHDCDP